MNEWMNDNNSKNIRWATFNWIITASRWQQLQSSANRVMNKANKYAVDDIFNESTFWQAGRQAGRQWFSVEKSHTETDFYAYLWAEQ